MIFQINLKNPKINTKILWLEKGENKKEYSAREKAWEEFKRNVRALQKPRNILLVGSFGAGKSSFINTAITALTGEYKFYADVGSGSKHNTTRIHRYVTYEMRWTTEKTLRGAIGLKKWIFGV